MGNTRKSPSTEKATVVKTAVADNSKLEADLIKKHEEEIARLKEELMAKDAELKSGKPKVKYVPENTKIRIKSNIGGTFIFQEDRGKTRAFINIAGYGQSIIISYAELELLRYSKQSFIRSGTISIDEVFSNEGIEFDDVVKELKLDDMYLDKKKIDPRNIEEMFNDEITSDSDFGAKLNASPDMGEVLVEVANVLYKRGQFNNNTKMNLIRQKFGRPNLFK